ncbi:MAG: YbaB/EbfC family nucleoid-associated protein [Candidatus Puniceispirillum sp.]|nr:YbaB/EbfC family nucleoid-associated protein [Candidatus Pelagibacter sp.]MBA4282945.1 YbaB/EbfC family nucleoid-associated protein [Candidatus Puniceispirillum sp.]
MKQLTQMLQQAQKMQQKMEEAQQKLESVSVEGKSGGGLVTVQMTAKGFVQKITVDPSLITPEDKEILEDLLVTALNDAKEKADAATSEEMSKASSGMNMPSGFKLPF